MVAPAVPTGTQNAAVANESELIAKLLQLKALLLELIARLSGGATEKKDIINVTTTNSLSATPTAPVLPASNPPPTISGVSGSNVLLVGRRGNWEIHATDPEGEALMYSVHWGDETLSPPPDPVFTSGNIFEHTYSRAGPYQVTFSVRDQAGQIAEFSLGIFVRSRN